MSIETSISTIKHLQSYEDNKPMEKPEGKNAKKLFLGNILNNIFDQMMPKKTAFCDKNTELFQGLYLAKIFEDPEIVDSFGIGDLLDKETNTQKHTLSNNSKITAYQSIEKKHDAIICGA